MHIFHLLPALLPTWVPQASCLLTHAMKMQKATEILVMMMGKLHLLTSSCWHKHKAVHTRHGGIQGLSLVQPEVSAAEKVTQQTLCISRPGKVCIPPLIYSAIDLLTHSCALIYCTYSLTQAAGEITIIPTLYMLGLLDVCF